MNRGFRGYRSGVLFFLIAGVVHCGGDDTGSPGTAGSTSSAAGASGAAAGTGGMLGMSGASGAGGATGTGGAAGASGGAGGGNGADASSDALSPKTDGAVADGSGDAGVIVDSKAADVGTTSDVADAATVSDVVSDTANIPSDAACQAPVNDAPVVGQIAVAGPIPTMQGGAIVDGKYHATQYFIYPGPDGGTGATGESIQETGVISGNSLRFSLVLTSNASSSTAAAGTFTVGGDGGTVLNISITCESPSDIQETFTSAISDAGLVTLTINYDNIVVVLTKQ